MNETTHFKSKLLARNLTIDDVCFLGFDGKDHCPCFGNWPEAI